MTSEVQQTAVPTAFPLVIPTLANRPLAKLLLRNDAGQVVQQWLIRQNKATLGSAAGCTLRCGLPGVAPYHVLIVVGAKQTFIRALAPKLARDGVSVNELLIRENESSFEIAGHRFELNRHWNDAEDRTTTPGQADRGRLKFTLARPFALQNRPFQQPAAASAANSLAATPLAANPSDADPTWVARLVQAALEPLECQIQNALSPIAELQADSRRQKRRRKRRIELLKKRKEEQRDTATDEPAPPDPLLDMKQQIELAAAHHSASIETLQERLSDVNQQLQLIERLVAEERAATTDSAQQIGKHGELQAQQASTLENQHATLVEQAVKLERQQSTLEESSALLARQQTTLDLQSSSLERQSSILERQETRFEQQHTTLEQQHTTLEQQHTTLEQQHTTLEQQHTTLEQQHTTLEQQHSTLERQHSTLEQQGARFDQQNALLSDQSSTLSKQLATLEQQEARFEQQQSALEQQNATLGDQAQSLATQTRELCEQRDLLNQQLETLRHQSESLDHLNNTLSSHTGDFDTQATAIRDVLQTLRDQSQELSAKLSQQVAEQTTTANDQNAKLDLLDGKFQCLSSEVSEQIELALREWSERHAELQNEEIVWKKAVTSQLDAIQSRLAAAMSSSPSNFQLGSLMSVVEDLQSAQSFSQATLSQWQTDFKQQLAELQQAMTPHTDEFVDPQWALSIADKLASMDERLAQAQEQSNAWKSEIIEQLTSLGERVTAAPQANENQWQSPAHFAESTTKLADVLPLNELQANNTTEDEAPAETDLAIEYIYDASDEPYYFDTDAEEASIEVSDWSVDPDHPVDEVEDAELLGGDSSFEDGIWDSKAESPSVADSTSLEESTGFESKAAVQGSIQDETEEVGYFEQQLTTEQSPIAGVSDEASTTSWDDQWLADVDAQDQSGLVDRTNLDLLEHSQPEHEGWPGYADDFLIDSVETMLIDATSDSEIAILDDWQQRDSLDADSLDAGSLDADSLDADSLDADSLDADALDADALDADALDADALDADALDADAVAEVSEWEPQSSPGIIAEDGLEPAEQKLVTELLATTVQASEIPADGVTQCESAEAALSFETPSLETPTFEAPTLETPTLETPTLETPTLETPTLETPTLETPTLETPTLETPTLETPTLETPTLETPTFETPTFETPTFETPTLETPTFETPTLETPTLETPTLETPTLETPTLETPTLETPTFETPTFETPTFETPTFETPTFETPTFETPSFETPSFETPSLETPSLETPTLETPTLETPTLEIPTLEIPTLETQLSGGLPACDLSLSIDAEPQVLSSDWDLAEYFNDAYSVVVQANDLDWSTLVQDPATNDTATADFVSEQVSTVGIPAASEEVPEVADYGLESLESFNEGTEPKNYFDGFETADQSVPLDNESYPLEQAAEYNVVEESPNVDDGWQALASDYASSPLETELPLDEVSEHADSVNSFEAGNAAVEDPYTAEVDYDSISELDAVADEAAEWPSWSDDESDLSSTGTDVSQAIEDVDDSVVQRNDLPDWWTAEPEANAYATSSYNSAIQAVDDEADEPLLLEQPTAPELQGQALTQNWGGVEQEESDVESDDTPGQSLTQDWTGMDQDEASSETEEPTGQSLTQDWYGLEPEAEDAFHAPSEATGQSLTQDWGGLQDEEDGSDAPSEAVGQSLTQDWEGLVHEELNEEAAEQSLTQDWVGLEEDRSDSDPASDTGEYQLQEEEFYGMADESHEADSVAGEGPDTADFEDVREAMRREEAEREEAEKALHSSTQEASSSEPAEDEDSVEDYMRKLLARMRGVPEDQVELPSTTHANKGGPASQSSSSANQAGPPATEAVPAVSPWKSTTTTPRANAAANDTTDGTLPFDPDNYVPRALAPEASQGLNAMRELANNNARTAIYTSSRQRYVTSVLVKLSVAGVGLVVGVSLLAINGLQMNIGLIAALASFVVTAIWGFDGLQSLKPLLQSSLVLQPEADGNAEDAAKDTE